MFEGRKTDIFWAGLIILAFASISLFTIVWYDMAIGPPYYGGDYWKHQMPLIVGAIVFVLIGLYMMKSGVKKEEQ